MHKIKAIHFIGIGGIGMSGLAEMVMSMGYLVSGSDLIENASTKRLQSLGARIYLGHASEHVSNADLIVVTSIIKVDNPEFLIAKDKKIPIIRRAKLLGELMLRQRGIAISGSHGKTTTTSLVTSVMLATGTDPSFSIGGKLLDSGLNAKFGTGNLMIVEADESDASFLDLSPTVVVITNINTEHLAFFKGDFERLKQTFVDFINSVPFYGYAILCLDCPVIREILPLVTANVFTYGFNKDADYRIVSFLQYGTKTKFTVKRPNQDKEIEVSLNLPGKHNVANALATLAVATQEGIEDNITLSALAKFSGVGRRFELQGELLLRCGNVLFIDDYGHHPKELQVTVNAIYGAWPGRRLVMVFQPHKYTRTQDLFFEFVEELAKVDVVVLLEVYAANEEHIIGADSDALASSLAHTYQKNAILVHEHQDLALVLASVLQDGDICLMQGAGNIGSLAYLARDELKNKLSKHAMADVIAFN